MCFFLWVGTRVFACSCLYVFHLCSHMQVSCMCLREWTVGLEVYAGLAVPKGFLLPRQVTFVISYAPPSTQGFCQAGLSLKGPMPDHQSRSLHQPLAVHSLDRKELTLAFKQGQAKSSCQSQKLDSVRLRDLDSCWKQNRN